MARLPCKLLVGAVPRLLVDAVRIPRLACALAAAVGATRHAPADQPARLAAPRTRQVHGSLLEALNAASAPAKAELAAAALPPAKDGQPQQSGSPSLAAGLLLLATALLKAAGLSLKRSAAIAGRLPAVAAAAAAGAPPADVAPLQAALQAATGAAGTAVDAGKRQAAEASGKLALAEPDEAAPGLAAAQAAYGALQTLQQALVVEALAAASSLRLQEGKPADGAVAGAGAAAAAEAAAANGGADGGKKKDKKKDKGGPQGMQLGRGTAQLRAYVEHAAAGGGLTASGDDVAGALRTLSLDGGDADLTAQLARLAPALDPLGHALTLQLAALRAVIEANQVCPLLMWPAYCNRPALALQRAMATRPTAHPLSLACARLASCLPVEVASPPAAALPRPLVPLLCSLASASACRGACCGHF